MNTKSPHLDPDWLRQKYEAEGLSTYDIGKLVGRDPKNVYAKLVEFGIPTRPRGLNLKGEDHYLKRPGVVGSFSGRNHSDATKAKLSRIASAPRPWLRGDRNGMAGRTGAANPNYQGGSSPERQRLYCNSEWRKLVRLVRSRDGSRCRRCEEECLGKRAIARHHIRPWAGNPSLRFDPENIVTLCRSCHEWVHSNANVAREFLP